MKCAPPVGSTLTSGNLASGTIEISRGTVIIIVTCNPTYCFRFTNQDPDFPEGVYRPEPGGGAHAQILPI